MLSDGKLAALQYKGGLNDPRALARRVLGCGFNPLVYLNRNPQLLLAGGDAHAGLSHFLEHGYAERRHIPCGPLPDGLVALAALKATDRAYLRTVFRSVFLAQLHHADTPDRLWEGPDASLLQALQRMDAVPYYVIGDADAAYYTQPSSQEGHWLAALPLICDGAATPGLVGSDGEAGWGGRILQWARAAAALKPRFQTPVFLKFGGSDAEFLWVMQRVRKRVRRFSMDEFAGHADQSVSRFGAFLDRLVPVIGPGHVRVCSVFPSVLPDAGWVAGFVAAYRGPPENRRHLAELLSTVEIPGRKERTQLRQHYNAALRALCEARGIPFIDDCSPLLDDSGDIDARFLARQTGGAGLDHAATAGVIAGLVRGGIESPG